MARFVRLGNDIVTRKNLGEVMAITMIDGSVYYAKDYDDNGDNSSFAEITAPNGVKFYINCNLIKTFMWVRVFKGTTSSGWEVYYIMDANTKVKVNNVDSSILVADSISASDVNKFFK